MKGIAVAVAILAQGCSFAFVSGPPTNHARLPSFECSTGKWAPIVDTVVAGIQAVNFAAAASSTDQKWHDTYCSPGDEKCSPPASRGATMALSAAVAAVFGASVYYGFTRVGECKEAKSELAERAVPLTPAPIATEPVAPAPIVAGTPIVAPTVAGTR